MILSFISSVSYSILSFLLNVVYMDIYVNHSPFAFTYFLFPFFLIERWRGGGGGGGASNLCSEIAWMFLPLINS